MNRNYFFIFVALIVIYFQTPKLYAINFGNNFLSDTNIVEERFFFENHSITLTYEKNKFFTGKLLIVNEMNPTEYFEIGSTYSEYLGHEELDLDNDGRKELIINLSTGASIYVNSFLYIFDFKKNIKPIFQIDNANIFKAGNDKFLTVYTRISPSFLGIGYTYFLKLDEGKLKLVTDFSEENLIKQYSPNDSEYLYTINEYIRTEKSTNALVCDYQYYLTYFAVYALQQKLLGNDELGWDFIEENFKCMENESYIKKLEKNIMESYNAIKNFNYSFSN